MYMNGTYDCVIGNVILCNRLHLQLEYLPASVTVASKGTADGALHNLPAGARDALQLPSPRQRHCPITRLGELVSMATDTQSGATHHLYTCRGTV